MPALSTLTVCEHTQGYTTFSTALGGLAAIDPPVWLTFTDLGFDVILGEWVYEYTVANDAPIGVYTVYVDGSDHYIVITVSDCAIDVSVCLLTVGSITPAPPEGYESWVQYLNGTSGQVVVVDSVLYYQFTSVGTYWISLLADGRTANEGPYVVYRFTVTNCFIDDTNCTDYPLKVKWLNPTGGMSSYVFGVKKIYGVDIGGSTTWKDSDRITRYLEHSNVYDSVVQISGIIPETHVDFLKSLKYAIAAWVENDLGSDDIEDRPIFNYAKSFELKRQANGFYKYDIEFNYSEEIITQTP